MFRNNSYRIFIRRILKLLFFSIYKRSGGISDCQMMSACKLTILHFTAFFIRLSKNNFHYDVFSFGCRTNEDGFLLERKITKLGQF